MSGKFEVRVDPTHLRFTLHPDRALNAITPGTFSVGQPTASSRQAPASLEESNF